MDWKRVSYIECSRLMNWKDEALFDNKKEWNNRRAKARWLQPKHNFMSRSRHIFVNRNGKCWVTKFRHLHHTGEMEGPIKRRNGTATTSSLIFQLTLATAVWDSESRRAVRWAFGEMGDEPATLSSSLLGWREKLLQQTTVSIERCNRDWARREAAPLLSQSGSMARADSLLLVLVTSKTRISAKDGMLDAHIHSIKTTRKKKETWPLIGEKCNTLLAPALRNWHATRHKKNSIPTCISNS